MVSTSPNPGRPGRLLLLFVALYALLTAGALAVPEKAPEADGTGPIEVTDMTGRTVRLDGPARRVMMLTPNLWHYLAVEETGDHLLMLAPFMKKEADDSVLGKIFPELDRKPLMAVDRRNSAPFNVEETLMAAADLVFVWEYLSPGYERMGVKGLIKYRSDGGDKSQFYDILGRTSAKPERVRRLWEIYDRRMARFTEAFSDLASKEPQTIIVLANDSFSLWSDNGFKRFSENLVKVAGRNLAGSARPALGPMSMEALLQLDPDVIYLNFHNLSWSTLTIGDLLSDPRLQGMRAIRTGRVYHMPLGAMRLEGPVEEPLFMAWMAMTLHPGSGGGLDLRREIRDSYSEAVGYHLTDDDIDNWLRYEENSSRPGHFVFDRNWRPDGGGRDKMIEPLEPGRHVQEDVR